MKKVFAIFVIVLMLVSSGCDGNSKENPVITAVAQNSDTGVVEEHTHDANQPIELDKGRKWVVVPEMMKLIREMEISLNNFEATEQTQLQDYFILGNTLQNNIDLLTSNCTMEGKGHDELHKWLIPFIDNVRKLNNSDSEEKASQVYKELKDSYKLVNNYFE